MKKVIKNAIIISLIIVGNICFAASAANFETWYVGAENGLNLRTEPNTNSDILTIYPIHTPLTVIGTDGGEWWEVYDGTLQGWVNSQFMISNPVNTTEVGTSEGAIGECLGTFWVTGYTASPEENAGYVTDCFGDLLEPQVGNIVAVDPSVIPLNQKIYIEGVGYRMTHDTGVYGNTIDVLTASNAESESVTAYRKVYLAN